MPQPINLPQALQNDAQRIWQLLTNVGELTIGQLGAIQPGESLLYEWPADDTVVFTRHFDDLRRARLTLSNIHETGYESINWSEEETVGRADEFTVIDRVENLPANAKYSQQHSFTFGAVETLLESSKDGFETAAKARLGSISTPAGAELAQTVTKEYLRQFGSDHNWQETLTRNFEIEGPASFEIRAVRAQERRRRHMVGVPILDYSIEWGRYWGNGSYDKIQVASKSEFLQLLAGNASDAVGVMYTRRPGEVTWSGMEWPVTSTPTAGYYRERPQQGAIDARSEPVSLTREYNAVLSQGFRYYDLAAGDYADVPAP